MAEAILRVLSPPESSVCDFSIILLPTSRMSDAIYRVRLHLLVMPFLHLLNVHLHNPSIHLESFLFLTHSFQQLLPKSLFCHSG